MLADYEGRLKSGSMERLDIDRANWMMAAGMFMKFNFPEDVAIKALNEKNAEMIKGMLVKIFENGKADSLLPKPQDLKYLITNLITLNDHGDHFKPLLEIFSPFRINSRGYQWYLNLKNQSLIFDEKIKYQTDYYELVAMLYAACGQIPIQNREHFWMAMDTLHSIHSFKLSIDRIPAAVIKFQNSPIDIISKILSNDKLLLNENGDLSNFYFEICKRILQQKFNNRAFAFPQISKILYSIDIIEIDKIWDEAERKIKTIKERKGALKLAIFHKFRAYFDLFFKNKSPHDEFSKAIVAFTSMPMEERFKEFQDNGMLSLTSAFLSPLLLESFATKYAHDGSMVYGWSSFLERKSTKSAFIQYLLDKNLHNIYLDNLFAVVFTLQERNYGIQIEFASEYNLQLQELLNRILPDIKDSEQKLELTRKHPFYYVQNSSGEKELKGLIRTSMEKIRPLEKVNQDVIHHLGLTMIKKMNIEFIDSIVTMNSYVSQQSILTRFCLSLDDSHMKAELIHFLRKALAIHKKTGEHLSPDFFRLLGRIGSKNIEEIAIREIKAYPESGKSMAISKYTLGLLEAGKYYQAMNFIPMFYSDENHLEKYALCLQIEAIKAFGLGAMKPKNKDWNVGHLYRYEYNADKYFSTRYRGS
jgi:hypothetical protein